jgi:DNA-binding transcriptional MocR family regulator
MKNWLWKWRTASSKESFRQESGCLGSGHLVDNASIGVAAAVAAYRKLEDEGYIEDRDRSGFYIRTRPWVKIDEPNISKPKTRLSPVTGQELALHNSRTVPRVNFDRIPVFYNTHLCVL